MAVLGMSPVERAVTDVASQVASEMSWERAGAIAFVVVVPVAVCCLASLWRCLRCFCCHVDLPLGRLGFAVCSLIQALVLGLVVGLWAHWIPCFWLTCDLSAEGDQARMRGLLLAAVGGGSALLACVLFSCTGSVSPVCVQKPEKPYIEV